jgi:anti-anti-sigma factor
MNVKLDTKEKFTVITPEEAEITANMTEELQQLLDSYKTKDIPHLVVNFYQVKNIDDASLQMIIQQQQEFYNDNNSFVICGLNETIIKTLETKDCLDVMNITPTESEAWDIVQMEEIERELMKDFDNN